MTAALLIVAAVIALADWGAVAGRLIHLEYLLKPLTARRPADRGGHR